MASITSEHLAQWEGFGGIELRTEACFEHGEMKKGLPAIPDAPPYKNPPFGGFFIGKNIKLLSIQNTYALLYNMLE